MRISDIQIDNFGVCQNVWFESIRSQILVIYGPNEAGKTTTMEFIRNTLFGASSFDSRALSVEANQDNAGQIRSIDSDGNHWIVQRDTGTIPGLQITINGKIHPPSSLNRDLLGGIGPEVFHNVFTVGIGELQQLNQLNSTDAADFLYEMTTGFDRVNLGHVLRGICSTRQSIEDGHGSGTLVDLRAKQTLLKQQLDHYSERLVAWNACQNNIQSTQHTLSEFQTEQSNSQLTLRCIEACRDNHEHIQKLLELEQWLEANKSTKLFESHVIFQQLDELIRLATSANALNNQITDTESSLIEVTIACDEIKASLLPHDVWLRIKAFAEMIPWLKSVSHELSEINTNATTLYASCGNNDTFFGQPHELDPAVLNRRLLKELRQPARELRHIKHKLKASQNELEELNARLEQTERNWLDDSGWDGLGVIPDLDRPVFCIADKLQHYRHKLTQLKNVKAVVDDEGRNTSATLGPSSSTGETNRIVISNFILCATVFAIGGTMLGMALFFPDRFGLSFGASIFCTILGITAITAGVVGQIQDSKQRHNSERRRSRLRQLAELRFSDRDLATTPEFNSTIELDEAIKGTDRSLSILSELNRQASLIERLRVTKRATVDRQANNSALAEEARQHWMTRIQEYGIPSNITPQDLYNAVERAEEIHAIRRDRLDNDSQRLRKTTELADLELRLTTLLHETKQPVDHLTMDEKIETLKLVGTNQQELRDTLTELEIRHDTLENELTGLDSEKAAITRELVNRYATVGANNLRQVHELHESIQTLKEQQRRFTLIMRNVEETAERYGISLREIKELSRVGVAALEEMHLKATQSSAELSTKLNSLHQQLGGLKAERAFLCEPGDLNLLRLEAASVNTRIKQLEDSWKVWATSEAVSERVRLIYETQRQPETLRDASQWLAQMTQGAYVRIWTPLGEDLLYVDDDQNQSWVIDSLSRGTRESIYLSLRLALVRSYQDDGVSLPLILDDVLVNCDMQRSKHAISTIKRFADEVGQVLFFTCHEHIAKLLEDAGADVRDIKRPKQVRAPELQRLSLTHHRGPTTPVPDKGCGEPASVMQEITNIGNALDDVANHLTQSHSSSDVMHRDTFGDEIDMELADDTDVDFPGERDERDLAA